MNAARSPGSQGKSAFGEKKQENDREKDRTRHFRGAICRRGRKQTAGTEHCRENADLAGGC